MEFLNNLFQREIFKTAEGLGTNILNFISYLLGLFTKNPLYFLGGLVLLRVSQKGFKFKLSDLLNFKL